MMRGDPEGCEARVLEEVAGILAGADSALFITGAGISADSGLPTYRGVGGLYEESVTEEGVPIEVALSGRMLESDPALCWKYIARIEQACRGARPNRGHEVLALLERRIPRAWTLTQNVDGLHRAAGSENLIEIHGSLERLLCAACDLMRAVESFLGLEIPPRCPRCDRIMRPDVVLFGENLPEEGLSTLQRELDRGFEVVVSIGTTSVFPYIALPMLLARQTGAAAVEINPGETEVSSMATHRLRGRAAEVLEALWSRIEPD